MLYSSFDYFSNFFIFSSYCYFKNKDNHNIFSITKKSQNFGMTKCTSEILLDIGVILANSDQLKMDHLNDQIDQWVTNVSIWKHAGIFSGINNQKSDFIQKNSIVIDDTVYLFPNSVSDLENTLKKSLNKKVSHSSIKNLDSIDKSRSFF